MKHLVHVVPTLDPTHGGTVVAAMMLSEATLELTSEIITGDAPSASWLATTNVPVIPAGPSFSRFRWAPRLDGILDTKLRRADACVVHGLWQHHLFASYRVARRLKKPLLIFPHGMLDPWALKQSKWIKKIAWISGMKSIFSDPNVSLCFTTDDEMARAESAIQGLACCRLITPLGVDLPENTLRNDSRAFSEPDPSSLPSSRQETILFLGRLHHKKGCSMLIDAFAECSRHFGSHRDRGLFLRMAGPADSDEYLAQLQDQCRGLGLRIGENIEFSGMLAGNEKWQALAAADALILPSHQENFALVVGEALALGKPALLSDKVNTSKWVREASAGFVAEDTPEGTKKLLKSWIELSAKDRRQMSKAAKNLYISRFSAAAARSSFAATVSTAISSTKFS